MQIEKEPEIFCLSDYLEVIERLKEDYPSDPMINNPTKTVFLYRGWPIKVIN